ncbi:hypothetical protein [Basilea psittacipulmonis]|uniref:Enoyl-CoA hydratase n=1 Tax=Basilea psittacipulmonis DSM 24701 TaxID=1072685 RepID=A0A077DIW5_9BURK|nr:hypothetical protein [Basilea psittacipulmonis]AIL33093.1 enoyl-CoA hydratase [Basilea psittacipulmonis DSM 24701]
MSTQVYLALYKGHRNGKSLYAYYCRFFDWLTRKVTKGIYSHCELAVDNEGRYECFSSSVRDKGVRRTVINLGDGKWDLIPVNIAPSEVLRFFDKTKKYPYDFWGALGVILKSRQDSNKYFCSEWVGECLGLSESWRFSPNDLAVIFKNKEVAQ